MWPTRGAACGAASCRSRSSSSSSARCRLAVPGLREVTDRLRGVDPGWIGLALGLEVLSCVGYVSAFRLVFSAGAVDSRGPRRAVGDGVRRRHAGRRRGRHRRRRVDRQGQGRLAAALHGALGGAVPAHERRQRGDARAGRAARRRRRPRRAAPDPARARPRPHRPGGRGGGLERAADRGALRARGPPRPDRWLDAHDGDGRPRHAARGAQPDLAAGRGGRVPVVRHRDAVGLVPARSARRRRSARSRSRSSSATSATSCRCRAASARSTAA